MLFNSYEFIFLYLPIVFVFFFIIAKYSIKTASIWLVLASLFFYAWWDIKAIAILIISIVFNYYAGYLIANSLKNKRSKSYLVIAISANLLFLAIFKYANFFIDTSNGLGTNWNSQNIILPLGISFFTFTQIAFLVDSYKGIVREHNLIHYLLFVTWFPHLIAGPVLHHQQMMPQFSKAQTYKLNSESISVGITLFSLGLFKKVMLADQFALISNPIFENVSKGSQPTLLAAWIGVIAYSLQLYFDFSGYSDMAVGLSRLFNVKLPLNFNSPYKSENIIEFWRRWHMTLSKFLFDYLYIPLGGNRKGTVRRYINLMLVMLLGGLWHGSGWNFILWGGLHGIYLVINHGWRKIIVLNHKANNLATRFIFILITFIAVVVAWVPFRSSNIQATFTLWKGMVGINGVSLPTSFEQQFGNFFGSFVEFSGVNLSGPIGLASTCIWLGVGFIIIWGMPNTQQWLIKYSPALNIFESSNYLIWRPINRYAIFTGVLFGICILSLKRASTFLYFQF